MPGESVTARALSLLAAFDERHRELTLTELAQRSALPLPTAYRLTRELVAWGALARKSPGSPRYVVGRRIWDLGLLAPLQTGLRQVASPFLYDLYAVTFATVHLAVRDGLEVLYVDRLAGHASVPVVSEVGSRLPMHATGVGKVLLAHAPPEVQREALTRLTRLTPDTITQPGKLARQLERARREGYAHTVEEMSLGACSVAVPIMRRTAGDRDDQERGEVVAALGVVVADLKRDRARLLTALDVAARGISRSLPTAP